MVNRVLIVGSGLSALQVKELDTSLFFVIAVNHGWMAAPNFNHWVRSSDYKGKRPVLGANQVELKNYTTMLKKYGGENECGKSMMLTASYYALEFEPTTIFYLGADMNYTPDEDGKTHIYGLGLDIQKHGIPDPDRMAQHNCKDDPDKYLYDIYMRFYNMATKREVQVYNLSKDPNSRLPYPKYQGSMNFD